MRPERRAGQTLLHCPCGSDNFRKFFTYNERPAGETHFPFSAASQYYREVWRCSTCHHFVSVHNMDLTGMYQNDYVSSTYADSEGILVAFRRIISLDPVKSDNVGRVKRILEFAAVHLKAPTAENRAPTVLDIGSGLGVFLHRMKEAGWDCTALDNDPRLCQHANDNVGVKAVCGDFMTLENLGKFDVVTFNKVLEHVEYPVAMLAKSKANLRRGGFIYVELPDGEGAALEGPEREEFFIEHHHVFSMASLAMLASRAGFSVLVMERLQEPSTKYTLRAFLI